MTGFSKAQKDYWKALEGVYHHLESQSGAFESLAEKIYRSFQQGGILHVFGSGHAHMFAEELFHRAGGLVPVNAMLEEYLMPHMSPRRVGPLERTPGLGTMILSNYDLKKGEVILLCSQSGINAVIADVASQAKELGLYTVAITSLNHSKAVPGRTTKKLYEICDLVLDTGTPIGDACVELKGAPLKVAPLSTAASVLVGELLVARISEKFIENGQKPLVYQSANTPGGDQHNKSLEEKYRSRIPRL